MPTSVITIPIDPGTRKFRLVSSGLNQKRCSAEIAGGRPPPSLKRWRSQSGSVVGAFEAWLAHRSLATLALRLERSSAGALAVAGALREKGIEVFHPSDHAASAQMRQYGCLVGFVLESAERAQDVLQRCELVAEATSFGGVHATAERRERWGTDDVPPGFIRYSAGIEDPEDLVADLMNALA